MVEELEEKIRVLENRINELEEQVNSIEKFQIRALETFEHFAENSKTIIKE